ncbi:hypothetical protein [Proteus vulgaris]|nr:hypothetical protein [Proteus vulgaris]
MKLTDMAIKKAKPRENVYSLGDGNGLSLIVEPNQHPAIPDKTNYTIPIR